MFNVRGLNYLDMNVYSRLSLRNFMLDISQTLHCLIRVSSILFSNSSCKNLLQLLWFHFAVEGTDQKCRFFETHFLLEMTGLDFKTVLEIAHTFSIAEGTLFHINVHL